MNTQSFVSSSQAPRLSPNAEAYFTASDTAATVDAFQTSGTSPTKTVSELALPRPTTLAGRMEILLERDIPVIPLRPKGKDPRTEHAAHDGTTDPDIITGWIAEFEPASNVGACATYDGFWFLDDDIGILVESYEGETGEKFPVTFTVKTSRGFHFYFRHDEASREVRYDGKENSNVIEIPGVWKGEARCNHQYVVGPGSIHPSGVVYEIVNAAPIVAAPPELLEWVQKAFDRSEALKPKNTHKSHDSRLNAEPGFKKLFDAVGYGPLLRRINGLEDARLHVDVLEPGKTVPCPMPQHRHHDYSNNFGPLSDAPDMLHCFNCGWSGDMVAACYSVDGGSATYETMYDAAQAICSEENLSFQNYFPPARLSDESSSEAESPTAPSVFHRTELGNAKRLVAKFGAEIRFNPEEKKWYRWNGKIWAKDRIGLVKTYMKSIAKDILKQGLAMKDPDEQKPTVSWAMRSESEPIINHSLSLAASEPGIPILTEEFDGDINLLNVNNGTLDLRTGEFRQHRREDLLTNITAVDYDPAAKCPRWEQFLREVMDEETIPFLQRAVGYSLTGFTGEHCFFLLYGLGRNGKSTFLSIIQYILGAYAMQTDWQSFAASKNGGVQIRNDIARLHSARFVAAVESEHNVRLAEALIKSLTGGDRITARFLYQEAFEFVPQMKLWLATNHKPKVIGTDEAIWSRIKLIPFNIIVPPEKRDRHLMQKLKMEGPGILNWALEGLRQYREGGLKEPKTVSDATAQYRENSDVLQHFLDAKCTVAKDAEIRSSELYAAYKYWALESGEFQMNDKDFGMVLEERGFSRSRISDRKNRPGGMYWHGVTLSQNQAKGTESGQDSEDLPF